MSEDFDKGFRAGYEKGHEAGYDWCMQCNKYPDDPELRRNSFVDSDMYKEALMFARWKEDSK